MMFIQLPSHIVWEWDGLWCGDKGECEAMTGDV